MPNIRHWLKERERADGGQFRRDLEGLGDEDLSAALEHVRSRGTALQQHRLTGPLLQEIRSRGYEPPALPTGGDIALQAIDEGRPLASTAPKIKGRELAIVPTAPPFPHARAGGLAVIERDVGRGTSNIGTICSTCLITTI